MSAALMQAVALTWLGAAWASSMGLAASRRWLVGALPDEPRTRANTALWWLAAPWMLASLLVLLCFAPSLLALARGEVDHCPFHGDIHAHFCFVHGGHPEASPVGWALLAGLAAPWGLRLLGALRRVGAAWRRTRGLVSAASRSPLSLPSPRPFAGTVGLLRPRVVISDGLRAALPPPLLRAVLAHEQAHAQRNDNLWRAVALALATLHLRETRRLLLDEHALACERACDEEAARAVGRLTVAEALLAAARLAERTPPLAPFAVAFDQGALETRVQALLSDAPAALPSSWWRSALGGALAASAGVALADPLHHIIETALGALAR